MSECRTAFINGVEERLAGIIENEQLGIVIGAVMKELDKYEITDRCTALAVEETENERILKRYCACLLVDGKSQKTIRQYQRAVRKLSEFNPKPFTKMSAYDIRYYLACEKDRGLSNRTLENIRACVSAFFQWMTIEDVIPKNPVLAIKPIKCPKEIRLPFSDVEIDAIRGACTSLKDRAIVEMLLSTGVRVNELSEMNISDVDFEALTVQVIHGKGDKSRTTYTTKVSALHVRNYLLGRPEKTDALFCNGNHKRLEPGGIRHILKQIGRRAGVENVHPHRFRRTFATGLAARGMEIQQVQKLMGHSNIDTTMKYIHVNDAQVRASYNQFIA